MSTRRSEPRTSRPELLDVHPQILVTDMERAVAFYRDRLGFQVAYLYGVPAYYGLVRRDGVGLNLRHVDVLPWDPDARARHDLLAASVVVSHLKPLFVAYERAGVPFHQRYREQPWDAHDFVVVDPDGNLVHFATRPGEP
jgi:catechol 2,3-dioxygenase-like lactoylglutathione lyase family enzyme